MGQKIYFNWQDDDSTKDLNHRFLGLIEPGRYRGYDADLATPGGLTLRLHHNTTGVDMTQYDASYTVERRGMLFTKQGVVIQESADIDIPISPNNSINPRIDLIICEHEYIDVPGASTADYVVVEGTPAAIPVEPTLPTPPQIKTIIGYLYLPGGTTALTDPGVVYTPATPPNLANIANILFTNQEQTSTAEKTFNSIKSIKVETEINGSGLIDNTVKSNYYYITTNNGPISTNKYIPIEGLISSLSEDGKIVSIYTLFPLHLKNTATLSVPADNYPNGQFIEANTVFMLKNVNGVWQLLKGGEPLLNRFNKFNGIQSLGGKFVFITPLYNAISLNSLNSGNFILVEGNTPVEIKRITSITKLIGNPNTLMNLESGTHLWLDFNKTHTLKHLSGSNNLANFEKVIYLSAEEDLVITPGTVVHLIEDLDFWRVIGIYNKDYNYSTKSNWLQLDVTAPDFIKNKPTNHVSHRGSGSIVLGDIGSLTNGTVLTGTGIVSATVLGELINGTNEGNLISVVLGYNILDPVSQDYIIIYELESTVIGSTADMARNGLVHSVVTRDKGSSGFQFYIMDLGGLSQDLTLNFYLIDKPI